MLQSQKNELTQSILKKLRQQGAPQGGIDLLGSDEEEPSEHEDSDYMGTQIREASPFMKKRILKKKKPEEQDQAE